MSEPLFIMVRVGSFAAGKKDDPSIQIAMPTEEGFYAVLGGEESGTLRHAAMHFLHEKFGAKNWPIGVEEGRTRIEALENWYTDLVRCMAMKGWYEKVMGCKNDSQK